jgi:hypothetical protein
MVDEIKSNLEPIEDSDLNLKEKFVGGSDDVGGKKEGKIEKVFTPELSKEKEEKIAEKDSNYSNIISKISPKKQTSQDEIVEDAETTNLEVDVESKISNLIKIAENKGIPHAVKVARHMEDNYALDEFHDRLLSEELNEALKKRGFIKEI